MQDELAQVALEDPQLQLTTWQRTEQQDHELGLVSAEQAGSFWAALAEAESEAREGGDGVEGGGGSEEPVRPPAPPPPSAQDQREETLKLLRACEAMAAEYTREFDGAPAEDVTSRSATAGVAEPAAVGEKGGAGGALDGPPLGSPPSLEDSEAEEEEADEFDTVD